MFVLDTSAFLHGKPHLLRGYTTPSVLSEIKSLEGESALWVIGETVKVEKPLPYYVKKVKKLLQEIGEIRLSKTDISVLALALQKKLPILTDDYNLQNAAIQLGVEVRGILFGKIRNVLRFEWVCEGCGRKYPPGTKICPVCGGRVKPHPFRIH